MKRQALSILSMLSLFLMGSAAAQTVRVRAIVPFNFTVGNEALPAGEYDITSISANTPALLVKAREGNASSIVNSNSAQKTNSAQRSKLVFNVYGSHYFLAEIWTQGSDLGRRMVKSGREKEVAKELAMQRAKRVEVVASLY